MSWLRYSDRWPWVAILALFVIYATACIVGIGWAYREHGFEGGMLMAIFLVLIAK